MTGLEVNVEVSGEEVLSDVRDAIRDGMKEAGDELSLAMEDEAKRVIRRNAAIFSGTLISSFTKRNVPEGKDYIVELSNDAENAWPIEVGAEYDEEGPPVRALIPWVQVHFDGDPIQNAFWLQEKIKEEGIDGIGFMQEAEDWADSNADQVVRDQIELELRSEL